MIKLAIVLLIVAAIAGLVRWLCPREIRPPRHDWTDPPEYEDSWD